MRGARCEHQQQLALDWQLLPRRSEDELANAFRGGRAARLAGCCNSNPPPLQPCLEQRQLRRLAAAFESFQGDESASHVPYLWRRAAVTSARQVAPNGRVMFRQRRGKIMTPVRLAGSDEE